jgi:acetoin utilization deacetylase AcuC-like enzyme
VAIPDVDVDHGNGTQDIFYERPDVLTVSIHADPAFFNPFVWGHAHERGTGPGLGANPTFRSRFARGMTAICGPSPDCRGPSV